MPRKGRRSPVSFTLIIVPHSEKPSFAVRVPFWAIYVMVALILVGLARLAVFVYEYQQATSQIAQFRRGGQMEIVRQRETQETIAAQQDEITALRTALGDQATAFGQEAERFDEEMAHLGNQLGELEQFKAEIRNLVGLNDVPSASFPLSQASADRPPQAAPTAQVAPSQQPTTSPPTYAGSDEQRASAATPPATVPTTSAPTGPGPKPTEGTSPAAAPAGPSAAATPGIGPLNPPDVQRAGEQVTSRGVASPASLQPSLQTVTDIQSSAAEQKAALDALKQQVGDRVAKVQGQWSDASQLAQQLSLYDAAPRAWPVRGRIYSPFGYHASRISVGANPNHKGVDITSSYGTPVLAPQDGVVTFVGPNGNLGQTVEIRHSLGWTTLYAHLQQQVPVKAGDRVKTGQTIGYAGLTGLTTGPHLHYEIHLNGTAIDPEQYLGK